MLGLFKKQKVQVHELTTQFVDSFLPAIDAGFPEIAALINESCEFIQSPEIDLEASDKFLLIALAANTKAVKRNFTSKYDQVIIREILELVSYYGQVEYQALVSAVSKNEKFISKVNHPSKNLVYGMSKALFYKYELSKFQEEYFRNLNSPNPIFLKRLDEAVECFLWDWEKYSDR